MHNLTQIYKVTIVVFLTAMVAVLFSTLTGCQGCNAEKETVRWVPAPRDTIPEIIVEDSLNMEPVDAVVITKPARKKQPASQKIIYPVETVESYGQYDDKGTHPYPEEYRMDSIKLTIITSELEMQITQNFN